MEDNQQKEFLFFSHTLIRKEGEKVVHRGRLGRQGSVSLRAVREAGNEVEGPHDRKASLGTAEVRQSECKD